MLDRDTLIENLENVVLILEDGKYFAAAQDVRDAAETIKRLMPRWSNEKPAVAGMYAWRTSDEDDAVVGCELFTQDDIDLSGSPPYSGWYAMREFCGPFLAYEPTPETGGQSCS
jgi:hypothetical protein